uniref:Uncharacterized protein n=1 Tax=Arundo donax TaxID=35708 RepID=A0A0A9C6P7_ARUDO
MASMSCFRNRRRPSRTLLCRFRVFRNP